jgi:hypothetical protein
MQLFTWNFIMKIYSIILLSGMLLLQSAFAQKEAIELTFTAADSTSWVQLDSIRVLNRSRYGNAMLYWPDTMLSIYLVGLDENSKDDETFQLFQA